MLMGSDLTQDVHSVFESADVSVTLTTSEGSSRLCRTLQAVSFKCELKMYIRLHVSSATTLRLHDDASTARR